MAAAFRIQYGQPQGAMQGARGATTLRIFPHKGAKLLY
jgi:hypothetical protein